MKPLWLIGGLGLGMGLMYLLDPEKGERHRGVARARLASLGRQTEDFLDDATRTIGQQGRALIARAQMTRRDQHGLGERLRMQAEQRGTAAELLIIGLVGLGAGLIYMLEPSEGSRRRALVCATARNYWRKTGNSLRSVATHGKVHGKSGLLRGVRDGTRAHETVGEKEREHA